MHTAGNVGIPALVARQWEEALTLADTAGLTTSLHALARGMTIGDTSGLTPDQQRCYRASGLTHLTAVSGANVSYVLLLAGVTLHHASPRRPGNRALSPPCSLRGADRSRTSRAPCHDQRSRWRTCTVGKVDGAPRFLHSGAAVPALSSSHRFLRCPPDFPPVAAATAALIWAAPRLAEQLTQLGLPLVVGEVLAVAAVAASSTLPLSLYLFGTASVLGVLANTVVAPVVPLITAVGLVGVATSLFFPPVGAVVLMVLLPALWWVEKVGGTLGGPGWSQLALPEKLSPGQPNSNSGPQLAGHRCACCGGARLPHTEREGSGCRSRHSGWGSNGRTCCRKLSAYDDLLISSARCSHSGVFGIGLHRIAFHCHGRYAHCGG